MQKERLQNGKIVTQCNEMYQKIHVFAEGSKLCATNTVLN